MIWLIGNRGMLGSEVHQRLIAQGIEHVATDLDVDITNRQALDNFSKPLNLSWIVNCSAYTAVDRAEEEPEQAFRINAEGPRNLALLALQKKARILHISTDYVFDGHQESAYLESDTPNPLGVYGRSKLQGELYVRETMDRYVILRTSWLYGPSGNNFVRTMLRLFQERDEVRIVTDQWGSPTLAGDLADVIVHIVRQKKVSYGIFHFANEGKTNWFGFASLILESARRHGLVHKEVRLIPIKAAEYPSKVVRPTNSYLSKEKIKATLGIHVRSWQEALESFMADIVEKAK
jgi:dTDP-4-dehydrorhamnose reductase